MVKLAGATPKFIYAGDDQGFKVSAKQVEEALSPNTKLVILNSPSNPTGCLYNRQEIEEIVELACKRDFLLLSDEIYEYLLYDEAEHHRPASFDAEARQKGNNCLWIQQNFLDDGVALGYTCGQPHYIKSSCLATKSNYIECDYIRPIWSTGRFGKLGPSNGCRKWNVGAF